MPEQKPVPDRSSPSPRRSKRDVLPGKHAQADGLQLRSYDVGALPLLKRIVERMQLQRILSEHLPRDDSRTELPTVTALLVLFANLLIARQPVYGGAIAPVPRISTKSGPFSPGEWLESLPGSARGY